MSHKPENIDQIEDFYKNHLKDIEFNVPEGLWTKIDASLNENPPTQKPSNPYLKYGIGSTMVVLMAVISYIFINKNTEKTQSIIPSNDTTTLTNTKETSATKVEKSSLNKITKENVESKYSTKKEISTSEEKTSESLQNSNESTIPSEPATKNETPIIIEDKTPEKTIEKIDSLPKAQKSKSLIEKLKEKAKGGKNELFKKEEK